MVIRLSLLILILAGCATTSASGTFTQALSAAEAADDAIVVASTSLLQAGTISSVQASKILTITDGINAALTLANTAYTAGNLTSASTQISTVVGVITAVQACLTAASNKQPIDTCLAPVSAP
jgi:thiamine monophosphate kinase